MPDANGRFRLSISIPTLPWKRESNDDKIAADKQRVAEQADLEVRESLGLPIPKPR